MWILLQRTGSWLQRAAIALAVVWLVWLIASLMVAYRLTHRLGPRFEERAPSIVWGSFEDHRIKTSDGEELGAWYANGWETLRVSSCSMATREVG